jgi:hypothetical protein
MMQTSAGIETPIVLVRAEGIGRSDTVLLASKLTAHQRKAVKFLDLDSRLPILLLCNYNNRRT